MKHIPRIEQQEMEVVVVAQKTSLEGGSDETHGCPLLLPTCGVTYQFTKTTRSKNNFNQPCLPQPPQISPETQYSPSPSNKLLPKPQPLPEEHPTKSPLLSTLLSVTNAQNVSLLHQKSPLRPSCQRPTATLLLLLHRSLQPPRNRSASTTRVLPAAVRTLRSRGTL